MHYLTTKQRHVLCFIPVVLSVIILAACTVPEPTQIAKIDIQAPLTKGSDWYLQQMQNSLDQSKTNWQILALRALLKEDKIAQATQLANTMPSNLTAEQQTEFDIISADISLRYNDKNTAIAKLKQVDPNSLSPSQMISYYPLVIASHSGTIDLDIIRAYIGLQPLLKGDAAQTNINATWQALLQMPEQNLNNLVINANEYTLAGWLELLNRVNINKTNQDDLASAIRDWQIRYPEHPAAKQKPDAIQALLKTTNYSDLRKVAVLLPLTGPGAVFSKAIQQGIEDAHNGTIINAQNIAASAASSAQNPASAANQQETQSAGGDMHVATANTNPAQGTGDMPQTAAANPSQSTGDTRQTAAANPSQSTGDTSQTTAANPIQSTGDTPQTLATTDSTNGQGQLSQATSTTELQFYDTNSQPIVALVKQAQQEGAQLIIGPLLKPDVEKVTQINAPVNILALNQLENPPVTANVCYFSLSPENEAKNAADHIWAQNKRAPLLLVPSSELGQRVVMAFSQEWYRLGGDSLYQQKFGDYNDLKVKIGSRDGMALNGTLVAKDPSNAVSSQDPTQTEVNVEASPTTPDSVYVVANQNELGLIKPMITMNIGAKNTIAFYASSLSAQGGAGTDFRFEMEGLQFSDIPLLSGEKGVDSDTIIHQFNNDYNQVRLYAMGLDAWQLAQHFNQLRQQPSVSLDGQTGKLQADSHCVLNRELSWSRYSQGKIVPVS